MGKQILIECTAWQDINVHTATRSVGRKMQENKRTEVHDIWISASNLESATNSNFNHKTHSSCTSNVFKNPDNNIRFCLWRWKLKLGFVYQVIEVMQVWHLPRICTIPSSVRFHQLIVIMSRGDQCGGELVYMDKLPGEVQNLNYMAVSREREKYGV